jgi:hypothetical protein
LQLLIKNSLAASVAFAVVWGFLEALALALGEDRNL